MKVLINDGYCINLDSRKDRWEQVTTDFKRLSNIMDITINRISAVAIPENPQNGVSKSVKNIITMAKEKDLPYVLIMEDDLFVIDANKVMQCLNNAPDKWDILSGGVYYFCKNKEYNEDWMQLTDFCGMHFIIINKSVYDTILNMHINGSHIDRTLGSLVLNNTLQMFVMYPMPCQQRSSFSNLRGRVVNDNTLKLPWIEHPDRLT